VVSPGDAKNHHFSLLHSSLQFVPLIEVKGKFFELRLWELEKNDGSVSIPFRNKNETKMVAFYKLLEQRTGS